MYKIKPNGDGRGMWKASEVKQKRFKQRKKKKMRIKKKKKATPTFNENSHEIDMRNVKIKMLDEHMDDFINAAMSKTKTLNHSSITKMNYLYKVFKIKDKQEQREFMLCNDNL